MADFINLRCVKDEGFSASELIALSATSVAFLNDVFIDLACDFGMEDLWKVEANWRLRNGLETIDLDCHLHEKCKQLLQYAVAEFDRHQRFCDIRQDGNASRNFGIESGVAEIRRAMRTDGRFDGQQMVYESLNLSCYNKFGWVNHSVCHWLLDVAKVRSSEFAQRAISRTDVGDDYYLTINFNALDREEFNWIYTHLPSAMDIDPALSWNSAAIKTQTEYWFPYGRIDALQVLTALKGFKRCDSCRASKV